MVVRVQVPPSAPSVSLVYQLPRMSGLAPEAKDAFEKVFGWSSLVARRAHNPKVIGSNPVPATIYLVAWFRINGMY